MASNNSLAKSYIRQAEERVKHAKEAFNDGNYPFTVRQCQEAVELFLKASLRIVGIEPPKWHDMGITLKRERERFPDWFRNEIDELAFQEFQPKREELQCMAMKKLAHRLN